MRRLRLQLVQHIPIPPLLQYNFVLLPSVLLVIKQYANYLIIKNYIYEVGAKL